MGPCPGIGKGVLLDLSDMKTIHDIDTRNRAVRFEPGSGGAYGEYPIEPF